MAVPVISTILLIASSGWKVEDFETARSACIMVSTFVMCTGEENKAKQ